MFRVARPAWDDPNLRALAGQVTSSRYFAHVRASTGSAVSRANCHPFRHGRWLFMHNGFIDAFHAVARDLVLDIDPSLYPSIEGQTDSEVLFHLALTLGLEDDPLAAMAAAVGLVEAAGRRRGVERPIELTIAATDGERTWGFRYASEGRSRPLLLTTDRPTLRRLYPAPEQPDRLAGGAHLLVSAPLRGMAGAWDELPQGSCVVASGGQAEIRRFTPSRSPRVRRPAYLGERSPG